MSDIQYRKAAVNELKVGDSIWGYCNEQGANTYYMNEYIVRRKRPGFPTAIYVSSDIAHLCGNEPDKLTARYYLVRES